MDYSQQKQVRADGLEIRDLSVKGALTMTGDNHKDMVDNIYRQYGFKFSCNFSGHEDLGLLSFAKPFIQYFIDQLIVELSRKKANLFLKTNTDALIDGFTPMYLNRLARVANPTLAFELELFSQRGELSGNSTEELKQSFVFKSQDKSYVEYLYNEYPELFTSCLHVSRNWVAFVLEFSEKLRTLNQQAKPASMVNS